MEGQYGAGDRRDGREGAMFWFEIPYRPDTEYSNMWTAGQDTKQQDKDKDKESERGSSGSGTGNGQTTGSDGKVQKITSVATLGTTIDCSW